MVTVRRVTQLSVTTLRYGTPLLLGGMSALYAIEHWEQLEAVIRAKITEPAKRAIADAQRFMASYESLLETEAKTHEERRRLDNLEYYRYSEVDFGEGLIVAEDYNSQSLAMAAAHKERKAEVEASLAGKR